VASYYDDNFGRYDIETEEDIEFYRYMQQTNIKKFCVGCGMSVQIQPQYAYCNGCADRQERGGDVWPEFDAKTGKPLYDEDGDDYVPFGEELTDGNNLSNE
jgi:hypothetical protein|tara:strand:- start:15192 stop:15494 length:303 start_codon:yes stop_codon:yes gene_type:complete